MYNIYNPISSAYPKVQQLAVGLIQQENQVIAEVAQALGLTVADAYSAIGNQQKQYILSGDVHPNISGQQQLAKAGEQALQAEVSAVKKINTPAPPQNVRATSVSSSGWVEMWDRVSGASDYNIFLNGKKIAAVPQSSKGNLSYSFHNQPSDKSRNITVTAVKGPWESVPSKADTVTTLSPLRISTSTLPDVLQGTPYNQNLSAVGGEGPYTFTVIDGSLPAGVSLKGHILQGTPTTSGSSTITVKAVDSMGDSSTRTLSVYVIPSAPGGFFQTQSSQEIININGGKMTATQGPSTADLNVPSGTFTHPVQFAITHGNVPSGLIPRGLKAVGAFGVNFSLDPAPQKPMTFTIMNPAITPQAKVYKIKNGKLIPIPATVSNGMAVITFTTDPSFVVTQPETNSNSSSSSGANSGSGTNGVSTVQGATSPVTGFPSAEWLSAGLAAVMSGGMLLFWTRRKRKGKE